MKEEIIHIWNAMKYSKDGFIAAFRSEIAFRIELIMSVILIPVASILPLEILEKIMLISSVLLVLIIELLNTAIELVIDRISKEHNALSKMAKDVSSAAVMVSLLQLALTWMVICYGILV